MPKTTKAKPKPKKRGPKEETLVITDDPKKALDRFLKTPPQKKR